MSLSIWPVLIDVFTRSIRGWYLGRQLDQLLTLTALTKTLIFAATEIYHADQRVQYAVAAYLDPLKQHAVQLNLTILRNKLTFADLLSKYLTAVQKL